MQLAWFYTINCSDATCLAVGLIMRAQEVSGLKCLGAGEVWGDTVALGWQQWYNVPATRKEHWLCGTCHESRLVTVLLVLC